MITGQNGYAFTKEIGFKELSMILLQSATEITSYFKNKKIKIHLVSFKDFYENCSVELKKHAFKNVYEFNTQPNMIFISTKIGKKKQIMLPLFQKNTVTNTNALTKNLME